MSQKPTPKDLKPARQPQFKPDPKGERAFRKLVDRIKLLIAVTVLEEHSAVLAELRRILAEQIDTTRLARDKTELARRTALKELIDYGYKFMNGTKLAANQFEPWTESSAIERNFKFARAREMLFKDYEKDALIQLERLEKRETLRRIGAGILRERNCLRKH